MRYIIIAILIYFIYLFIRRFLRNLSSVPKSNKQPENNPSKNRTYDINSIQDAEFREVKKE